jgi:hypothetical protein
MKFFNLLIIPIAYAYDCEDLCRLVDVETCLTEAYGRVCSNFFFKYRLRSSYDVVYCQQGRCGAHGRPVKKTDLDTIFSPPSISHGHFIGHGDRSRSHSHGGLYVLGIRNRRDSHRFSESFRGNSNRFADSEPSRYYRHSVAREVEHAANEAQREISHWFDSIPNPLEWLSAFRPSFPNLSRLLEANWLREQSGDTMKGVKTAADHVASELGNSDVGKAAIHSIDAGVHTLGPEISGLGHQAIHGLTHVAGDLDEVDWNKFGPELVNLVDLADKAVDPKFFDNLMKFLSMVGEVLSKAKI